MDQPNPEHLSFIDPVFLQQFGLNKDNALDYFALSPFYDKACNNEFCKMQAFTQSQLQSNLKTMTGTEYVLDESIKDPRLFVVIRQDRQSSRYAELQAIYYILEGTIYQAPSVLSLLNSRLSKLAYNLDKALDTLQDNVCMTDTCDYRWSFNEDISLLENEIDTMRRPEEKRAPVFIDNIVMQLMDKHVTPAAAAAAAMRQKEQLQESSGENNAAAGSVGLSENVPATNNG